MYMYLCGERLFPATAGANRRRYAATVQGACVVNCLELELSPFACVLLCWSIVLYTQLLFVLVQNVEASL